MIGEPLLDIWVGGSPATFATRGEQSWKSTLETAIPSASTSQRARGLIAEFTLSGAESGWHSADVDNLCEPLFSVVVNKKGWFGGRRPGIEWFTVSKQYGGTPGVHIRIIDGPPELPLNPSALMLMDGVYAGPLPTSARDEPFTEWVRASTASDQRGEQFAVLIQFPDAKVNLGDIATGRLKNVIDCLYPLVGGTAGAPEDWRIRTLHVVKGHLEQPEGGSVRVAVWLPSQVQERPVGAMPEPAVPVAEPRWIVVATKTIIWETEAESADEALDIVREVVMPGELPGEDPDDYQFSVQEMDGRVVYPHQEQPAFLRKHDERTAELRRVRELLDQLAELTGLPKTPEVDALMQEVNEFLAKNRRLDD